MSNRSPNRSELAALGFIAATLLPHAALAAEPTDPLNLQEPKRPELITPKPDATFELPQVAPPPATPLALSGETVLISRVLFRGNTVISTSELDSIAAPYSARTVDVAEIEELRQKLSRHYVEQGYVNSGALLAKDALDGSTLTFTIVEGKLNAIRLQGMERLHDAYVTKRLVGDINAPLNIDLLRERFQLLLGDPLIDRLNARLIPDTKLGEALLDVDVIRARPYQLRATVNNYRPPSIGANAVALSGWVRNLTGYGDFLESTLQDSTSLGNGRRASLGWQMPLNTKGTQLSLQLDHGRSSVVEEPMQSLGIKSTLANRDIGLSQNFYETLTHKFTMGVNRVWRENRTTLLGEPFSFVPGEPNGTTKIRAWRFWQEYSYRTQSQVMALRSTFTSASNNLQTIPGLAASQDQPSSQYGLWLGQLQYARQVMDNGAQLVVRGSLQHAKRHLLALDQISIGGIGTVRGYRENQLIRDKGAVINIELEYPLAKNANGLDWLLIPFYDYGRGKNQNEAASMLSSTGLASRMQWKGFNLDVAIAKRLSHSAGINTSGGTLQDKGIHFQLSYKFFGN